MRGDIDSINVPGTFQHFVDQLNLSAAKGMEYVLLEGHHGESMAISQKNILTVIERTDDTAGMMA